MSTNNNFTDQCSTLSVDLQQTENLTVKIFNNQINIPELTELGCKNVEDCLKYAFQISPVITTLGFDKTTTPCGMSYFIDETCNNVNLERRGTFRFACKFICPKENLCVRFIGENRQSNYQGRHYRPGGCCYVLGRCLLIWEAPPLNERSTVVKLIAYFPAKVFSGDHRVRLLCLPELDYEYPLKKLRLGLEQDPQVPLLSFNNENVCFVYDDDILRDFSPYSWEHQIENPSTLEHDQMFKSLCSGNTEMNNDEIDEHASEQNTSEDGNEFEEDEFDEDDE